MFFQSSTPASGKSSESTDDKKEDTSSTTAGPGPDGSALDGPVASLTLEKVDSTASSSHESALVDENSVKRLMDMGFMGDISREVLLKHNGNETAAINELLAST